MSLSKIVQVQITRETKVPTQKGFGTLLILGDSDRFAADERIRTYTDLASVIADFTTGDAEIDMATAAFSQTIKPVEIKIGQVESGDTDYTDALDAIEQKDDDWYGLVIEDETEAGINLVATWIEARIKLLFALTRDSAVKDGTAGNVVEDLNNAAYDRTAPLYSGAPSTQYLSAGLAGGQLPKNPGSITWKFKSVAGVNFDALTATEKDNIRNLKGNVYTRVAGQNLISEGTVASGEYIDVIRGADWIQARIQENVFADLVNADKVPFTNLGIAKIEKAVREILDLAITRGILSSYEVTVPDLSGLLPADIGLRCLDGIEFDGVLAGAIHKTKIAGRLVLS